MTLTKQDTAALRHADSLCFDHRADGTGGIRCYIRAENSSTGFEQVHTIAARMSSVQNYDPASSTGPFIGFESITSSKFDAVARTITRRLRVGEEFVLIWTRNNDSDLLREAGLVCDQLHIRIGNEKRADTFLIRTAVRRDDSARMIRVVN